MARTVIFTGTALALLAGAASAADLPRRAAPPVFIPVPMFTWTGAYFGINAGYAFSDQQNARTRSAYPADTFTAAEITALFPGPSRFKQEGFTGGGQIGYNYQFTPGAGLVVGFESDAQYTDLIKTNNSSGAGGFLFFSDVGYDQNNASRQKLDFLGTVRGRLGYAFGRVLVFGAGGFAYGQVDFTSDTIGNIRQIGSIDFPYLRTDSHYNKIQTGYVYGGGIEYALPADSFLNFFNSSVVTIKTEFLHYDLGTKNVVGFANLISNPVLNEQFPTTITRVKTEGNLVRAGLNYKFGSY